MSPKKKKRKFKETLQQMDSELISAHPFKSVEHFSIAVSEQTFVAVDVENIDAGVWFSMAFVISRYPSGTIVAMEEIFVDRSDHVIQNASIAEFWTTHASAYEYNLRRGIGIPEAAAEARVCSYIYELRRKNPHFFLVSDNPAFDVRILDQILTKHGHPPLSDRGFDLYAQVLDTWSYRMSLARIFNTKSPQLFQHPHVCQLLGSRNNAGTSVQNAANMMFHRPVDPSGSTSMSSMRHTPLRDCCEILSSFFKCLDLANAIGSLIRGAVAIPPAQRRYTPLRVVHSTFTPSQRMPLYAGPQESHLLYRQQYATVRLSREAQVFLPQQQIPSS